MKVKYNLLLKKSWNDLRNNLIIFLPYLFVILYTIGFMIVVGLEILIMYSTGMWPDSNLKGFIVLASIFGTLDLILMLIISANIQSMFIGLLKAIITNKKAYSKDMFDGSKKYTWIVFKVNLLKLGIICIPLLLLGLIVFIGFMINKNLGIILAIIFGLIWILYFFIMGLFLTFSLFFLLPIMTLNKTKSASTLFKESYGYMKKEFEHVILTWLIVLGITLGARIIYQLVYFPISLSLLVSLILSPILLILFLGTLVVGIWMQIFVFNSWFNKNIKKL